jgi:hypothetical protein
MFPLSDPQFHLDMFHQHEAELQRAAAGHRLAYEAARAGRHRRFGGWRRSSHRPRPVRAPDA